MSFREKDLARRFIVFIDAVYESKVLDPLAPVSVLIFEFMGFFLVNYGFFWLLGFVMRFCGVCFLWLLLIWFVGRGI